MQSWDSQLYKVLLPPTEKIQVSESDDSEDEVGDRGHDTNTLRPDYGLAQSRKGSGRPKKPKLLQKRASLIPESEEEEENRRYGLNDPELPHLSEEAKAGERTEDSYCQGDICRPSPACLGAGLVAGILVIFGVLVVFMVLEHKHEEKEKLEYLLRAAGGVAIAFCLLLCCCNSCVCCTRNLSQRPVSAPSYIRNIMAGVADSRRSSSDRRSSVPTIHVHSARPSALVPELKPSDGIEWCNKESFGRARLEKENLGYAGTDDVSAKTLGIVGPDGTDTSEDDGRNVSRIEKSGSAGTLGVPRVSESEKRDSVFTIDSYEMDPNARNLIPSENDDKNDEMSKTKEKQSLKMLGTLSLFIEAINSNSGPPKEVGGRQVNTGDEVGGSDPASDIVKKIGGSKDDTEEREGWIDTTSNHPEDVGVSEDNGKMMGGSIPVSDPANRIRGSKDTSGKRKRRSVPAGLRPKKTGGTKEKNGKAAERRVPFSHRPKEIGGNKHNGKREGRSLPASDPPNKIWGMEDTSGKRKKRSVPAGVHPKKTGGTKDINRKAAEKRVPFSHRPKEIGGSEDITEKEVGGSGPGRIKKTQEMIKKRKLPRPSNLRVPKAGNRKIGPAE